MTRSDRPRRRTALTLAALALLTWLAAPAAAAASGEPVPTQPASAEPATGSPPRFLIEELRIEGAKRASEAVIRVESRLRTGTAYTEDELRDAVVRIHRLPFVLTTEFALEKGSERGAYVLVIRVFETHRLFYSLDRRYTRVDEPVVLDGIFAADDSSSLRAAAGYRLRLGADGEAFVAADTEQGLQAGFTRYDLFGRGAALSVAGSKDYDDSTAVPPLGLDPRFSSWQIERGELVNGRLALPLTGNHGLLFRAEWLHGDDGFERRVLGRSPAADRLNRRREIDLVELGAAWIWDDSDDPLTPRSGRTFELALERLWLEAEGDVGLRIGADGALTTLDPDLAPIDSELLRLAGRAAHHVPWGPATSVSWSARAALGRGRVSGLPATGATLADESYDVVEATAGVVLRRTLWRPAEKFVTLWLEGVADVSYQRVDLDLPSIDDAVTQSRIGVRFTLRDSWGILRAGLYLVGVEGTDP